MAEAEFTGRYINPFKVFDTAEIAKFTGLTIEQIESLRKN